MKYLILITTLIVTSNSSIIGMDPSYKGMLSRIKDAAEGKPSITLINNSQISLCMEIGDLDKDGIRSHMFLHKNTEFTFSPYAHPFFLKEKYSKRGTVIDLYTTRPEEQDCQHKKLVIGGFSDIKFGDTICINYDNNTLKTSSQNSEQPKRASRTLKIKRRNTLK